MEAQFYNTRLLFTKNLIQRDQNVRLPSTKAILKHSVIIENNICLTQRYKLKKTGLMAITAKYIEKFN